MNDINITNATRAMHWRYAAKRMTNKIVPEEIIDQIIEAIHLSPSSLALQPYEIVVISNPEVKSKIQPIAFNQKQIVESSHLLVFAAWDKYTDERIDKTLSHILTEKGLPAEDIASQVSGARNFFKDKSDEFQFAHAIKQSSIALGIALLTAALEGIDASPMEGFNPVALDELLGLKEKGLRSTTLLALGYRDEAMDWNLKQKKVRKPLTDVFTKIN